MVTDNTDDCNNMVRHLLTKNAS